MQKTFALLFLLCFSLFGFSPELLNILDQALENGIIEPAQRENILNDLRQDLSCTNATKILSVALNQKIACQTLRSTYQKIKLTYSSTFFPEINDQKNFLQLNLKHQNFKLSQKFSLNSHIENNFTQFNWQPSSKNKIQVGHLSISKSLNLLIGRNYWGRQSPQTNQIFSIYSERQIFHGIQTKHQFPSFYLTLLYSFNPNQFTSGEKQKVDAQLFAIQIQKPLKLISIEFQTLGQFFFIF